MLTRSQRITVFLVTFVPVMVMVVWSAFYLVGQINTAILSTSPIISQELARRFGREVRVGRSTVKPFGVLVLEDVSISEGPTFASAGPMVTAPRIEVRYDFRGILFGGRGAGAVSTVEVREPRLSLLRRKDGTFNIADLLKRRVKTAGPAFVGKVHIVGGSVVFRDMLSGMKPLATVIRLHDVNGHLDAAAAPLYVFRGSVRGQNGVLGSADAVGSYDVDTKTVRVDVVASHAGVAFLSRYIGIQRVIAIHEGTADAYVGATVRSVAKHSRLALVGYARVSGITARLPWLRSPVTRGAGRIMFTNDRVVMDINATAANSPLHVTGAVTGFAHPRLGLSISSPSADYAALVRSVTFLSPLKQLHPSGRGRVDARVFGAAANPAVSANVNVPRASLQGYAARDAVVSLTYAQGLVDIQSAVFSAFGARVQATGTVSTGGALVVAIKGQARRIDLSRAPLPPDARMNGIVDADFVITGPISKPDVRADARISGGVFRGIPFSANSARVSYSRGRLAFDGTMAFNVASGVVRVSGGGTPSKLDLRYSAEGVDLSKIGGKLKQEGLEGFAYATGKVTGKIDDPHVTGSVEVFKARYEQYETDYLRVALEGNKRSVSFSNGIIRRFPADIRFSGQVAGLDTDRFSYSGEAHARRLQVEGLLAMVGRKMDVTGSIDGDLTFSGAYLPRLAVKPGTLRFVETAASGDIRLQDGTAYGYLISSLVSRISYSGNQVTITDTTIKSNAAEATIGGSVTLDDHNVDLSFRLAGFDLARVQGRLGPYVVASGIAGASGTISGLWEDVSASVNVDVDRLIFDGMRFGQAGFDATYTANALPTFHAKLVRDDQILELTGKDYDLETNNIASAKGTLTNLSVSDVWNGLLSSPLATAEEAGNLRGRLASVPRITGGVLNGTFEISGDLKKPNASARLVATNVGVDISKVESVVIDASCTNGAVTLKEFRALSEDTVVEVTPITPGAPVFENGNVHLAVTANNLDLVRLSPWLGGYAPNGTATVDFVVDGKASRPGIRGSVEVANPGFGAVTFDRLRISRIEFLEDVIRFSGIILATGGHQVSAEGYLPWDWSEYTVPRDKPLQFSARSNHDDLSLLGTFASRIDPKRTSGPLSASFDAGGTLADIRLDGSLSVVNGTLAIKGFTNLFTDINVNLVFDGKQVMIKQFSARSDKGGAVEIKPDGYVTIAGENAGVNLRIVADALALGEKNVLGYQEDISLKLNAGLSVTGPLAAPVVSDARVGESPGGITMFDAAMTFVAPPPGEKPAALVLPVDPDFRNVSLAVGENVWIRPPQMTLLVGGGGSLNGKLTAAQLAMSLRVREGALRLATTRLTVSKDALLEISLAPPEPASVTLRNFQATAMVSATDQLGKRNRYLITITVSGPLANMQIGLNSSPAGLTRTQMLAALGHVEGLFASGDSRLQTELTNVLTAVGSSALFMPVERLFVEKLGFEQFTLEYSAATPLSLYVSRRLFSSFYVSFYRRLSESTVGQFGQSAYQSQLSYRFGRGYEVGVGVDDQQTATFQVGVTRAFW